MKSAEKYRLHLYRSNSVLTFLPKVTEIIDEISRKNPFEEKFVIVQNGALGRWLSLKTAEETGILANINCVSPDEFLRTFAEKHFKIDTRNSVFTKKNLEWAVFSLLKSDFLEKPELKPVRNYIKNDESLCFGLCRRIAALFEHYRVCRPHIFENWKSGVLSSDNPDEIWQKEIFTALSGRYGSEPDFAKLFIEKCENASPGGNFPTSLILFGISRMSKYHLNIFRHLSRLCPVHVFAVLPSREYVAKPGKETFFRRFCATDIEINDFFAENPPLEESGIFVEPPAGTLLASIQRDILNDEEMPENSEFDDSVRISACCGRMRELEVLKDSILQLFNEDETLTPGDIAVFCPDIKSSLPYINAVFGNTPQSDRTFIPFSVSDGKKALENGISETFLKIIGLNRGNFTKSEILSIFKQPFVCEKFGINRENFDEIEKIIGESAIKRGLSGQNSWDFGLKRILMSAFLPFSENGNGFENILPLENLTAEKLAETEGFITFIKGLFNFSEELKTEKNAGGFKKILDGALDFFFVKNAESLAEIRSIKNTIANFAESAGKYSEKISSDAVAAYLEDELASTVSGRPVVGAKVNFSSLRHFSSIPFKVICLTGMDAESFPGKDSEYAFDLTHSVKATADEPRIMSRREEDFHIFLETIAAAGRKLIISYDSRDQRKNSKKHRQAAVPVQILEKYIAQKTEQNLENIETATPAQPFSPAYFFDEESAFKTFSKSAFAAVKNIVSRETSSPNTDSTGTSEQMTAHVQHIDLSLEKLVSFFKDPQKHYFTRTLGLTLPETETKNEDEEIFDYDDNLFNYNLHKTYLEMSRGLPEKETVDRNFLRRMRGEGKTASGIIGEEKLKTAVDSSKIREIAEKFYGENNEYHDFSLDFEELGVTLYGRTEGLRQNRTKEVLASVSSWKPKYKIETLIRHYAANATLGEVATEVFAIFKSDKKNFLEPLGKEEAKENLAVFIRLYLLAQKEMPLYNPEIIDDFRIAVNNDKTIDKYFISSEIEKIENEMFTNDYFRLAAGQFKKDTERFSERFPEEEITTISGFLKDFQQIKNGKGKISGKK